MPQQGIHTYYWMSNHWTIEYNEIAYAKIGLEFSPNFTIRNNYIHHNVGNASSSNPGERGGGYHGVRADNTTFEGNEIAYNGPEQKVGLSANVTFRNNFVHHNVRDGIWYDSNEMRAPSSKATAWRTTAATGFSSRPASAPRSGATPSAATRARGC